MHLIESIGPVLGVVAFLGLAILAFLLFQQGRDIRRLREWAGRAPERAQEAAEAVQAAAEASRGEGQADVPAGEAEPEGRLAASWARFRGAVQGRWSALDRHLPIDGRYLLAVAGVAVIVAGVLTSGFGVFGGNEHGGHHRHGSSAKPTVAVLNGTAVPGLAAKVDDEVVKPAGYKSGTVTNAGSSFANTVVMFLPGREREAKALATAVRSKLGDTPTQAMTSDVKTRAGGAPLALGLGLDDSRFAGTG
jgi:hypothetical protein